MLHHQILPLQRRRRLSVDPPPTLLSLYLSRAISLLHEAVLQRREAKTEADFETG